MKKLGDFVEKISDDFKSTFIKLSDSFLQNMIGDNEFEELTSIIKKYLGNDAKICYHKIKNIPTRSIYLIFTEAEKESNEN